MPDPDSSPNWPGNPRQGRNARPGNASQKEHPCGPLRVASYARVSSAAQAEREISIPAQQREIRTYVLKEGNLLVAEYADPGHSGTTMERPGLQQMLQDARAGNFDLVVIHKSDRLSREELDALLLKAEFKSHGVRLRSVTEPFYGGDHPMDEMMENIARGFNKLYISNLKTEIQKGFRGMALEHGRQSGHAPFGYRFINAAVKGSGWEIDPPAAVWVVRLFHEFLAGKTYSDLARELNAVGAITPWKHFGWKSPDPNPADSRWHGPATNYWTAQRVRYILGNPNYVGRVLYQGQYYPGSHPPLVDELTFNRVQAIIPTRTRNAANIARALFAGGALRCPHCGFPLISLQKKNQSKSPRASSLMFCLTYTCRAGNDFEARRYGIDYPAKVDCPGFRVTEQQVLALLFHHLDYLTRPHEPVPPLDVRNWRVVYPLIFAARKRPSTGIILKNVQEAFPPPSGPKRDIAAERAVIEREIASLPQMRRAYQDQQASGNMTQEELRMALASLDQRGATLREALAAHQVPKSATRLTARQSRTLRDVLEDPDIPTLQKRDILKMAFEQIVPAPDKMSISLVLHSHT